MKKCYYCKNMLLILCCAATVSLWANPIDKNDAKRIAAKYLAHPKLQQKRYFTRGSTGNEPPAYYLFNNADGNGFVIVSGEDRLNEVVGYGDHASVTGREMPEQLQALLSSYTQVVDAVRSGKIQPAKQQPLAYAKVAPLIRTRWGQRGPYALYTPKDGGSHTLTGCVATAIAQVMYYHNWPLKRPKSHPVVKQELAQLQENYLWSEMKRTYYPTENGMSVSAVATLMRDIGHYVGMTYGLSASGAYVSNAAYAVRDSFDYSVSYLQKNTLPAGEYGRSVMNELAKGYPVLASGGSHAWVFDGYDENGYLHCNFGWDGYYDGYFDVNTISLAQVGDGGGDGLYWIMQEAILMHPNNSMHERFEHTSNKLAFYGNGRLYFDKTTVKRNEHLTANLHNVCVKGLAERQTNLFTGNVGLGIYDSKGKQVKVIPSPDADRELTGYSQLISISGWDVDLTELDNGEYNIVPMGRELLKKPAVYADWQPIDERYAVGVVLTQNEIVVGGNNGRPALSMAKQPEVLTPLYENISTSGSVMLYVNNPTVLEIRGKLHVCFRRIDKSETYTAVIGGKNVVAEKLGTTEWLVSLPTSYMKDNALTSLPAGKYYLSFYVEYQDIQAQTLNIDIENDRQFQIEVLSQPANSLVSIKQLYYRIGESVTFKQVFDIDTPDAFSFAVAAETIANTGSSGYNGKLYYRLQDLADGSSVEAGSADNVWFPLNTGNDIPKTVVYFDLSKLKEGHNYEVYVEIEVNGRRIDVWNNHSRRRQLSVVKQGGTTAIDGITVPKKAKTIVYNLQGVRIDQPVDRLPKGLYIIDGKKTVIR